MSKQIKKSLLNCSAGMFLSTATIACGGKNQDLSNGSVSSKSIADITQEYYNSQNYDGCCDSLKKWKQELDVKKIQDDKNFNSFCSTIKSNYDELISKIKPENIDSLFSSGDKKLGIIEKAQKLDTMLAILDEKHKSSIEKQCKKNLDNINETNLVECNKFCVKTNEKINNYGLKNYFTKKIKEKLSFQFENNKREDAKNFVKFLNLLVTNNIEIELTKSILDNLKNSIENKLKVEDNSSIESLSKYKETKDKYDPILSELLKISDNDFKTFIEKKNSYNPEDGVKKIIVEKTTEVSGIVLSENAENIIPDQYTNFGKKIKSEVDLQGVGKKFNQIFKNCNEEINKFNKAIDEINKKINEIKNKINENLLDTESKKIKAELEKFDFVSNQKDKTDEFVEKINEYREKNNEKHNSVISVVLEKVKKEINSVLDFESIDSLEGLVKLREEQERYKEVLNSLSNISDTEFSNFVKDKASLEKIEEKVNSFIDKSAEELKNAKGNDLNYQKYSDILKILKDLKKIKYGDVTDKNFTSVFKNCSSKIEEYENAVIVSIEKNADEILNLLDGDKNMLNKELKDKKDRIKSILSHFSGSGISFSSLKNKIKAHFDKVIGKIEQIPEKGFSNESNDSINLLIDLAKIDYLKEAFGDIYNGDKTSTSGIKSSGLKSSGIKSSKIREDNPIDLVKKSFEKVFNDEGNKTNSTKWKNISRFKIYAAFVLRILKKSSEKKEREKTYKLNLNGIDLDLLDQDHLTSPLTVHLINTVDNIDSYMLKINAMPAKSNLSFKDQVKKYQSLSFKETQAGSEEYNQELKEADMNVNLEATCNKFDNTNETNLKEAFWENDKVLAEYKKCKNHEDEQAFINNLIQVLATKVLEKGKELMKRDRKDGNVAELIGEVAGLLGACWTTQVSAAEYLEAASMFTGSGDLSSLNQDQKDFLNSLLLKQITDVQRIAILEVILNGKNQLAQVATGAGKTVIIFIYSVLEHLLGGKIQNIVNSDPILLQRDENEFKDLRKLLNLENKIFYKRIERMIEDNINKKRKAFSEYFLGKKANEQIEFKNAIDEDIIIDEVDTLFSLIKLAPYIAGVVHNESNLEKIIDYIHKNKEINALQLLENIKSDYVIKDNYNNAITAILVGWGGNINEAEKNTFKDKFDKELYKMIVAAKNVKSLKIDTDYKVEYISENSKNIAQIQYKTKGGDFVPEVRGYETLFTLISAKEANTSNNETFDKAIEPIKGINLTIGKYSYISICKLFNKISGYSGTLDCLNNYEKQQLAFLGINNLLITPNYWAERKREMNGGLDKNIYDINILEQDEHVDKIVEEIKNAEKEKRACLVFFKDDEEGKKLMEKVRVTLEGKTKLKINILTKAESLTYEDQQEIINQSGNIMQITFADSNFSRGYDYKSTFENNLYGGTKGILTYLPESAAELAQLLGRVGRALNDGTWSLLFKKDDLKKYEINPDYYKDSEKLKDLVEALKKKELFKKELQAFINSKMKYVTDKIRREDDETTKSRAVEEKVLSDNYEIKPDSLLQNQTKKVMIMVDMTYSMGDTLTQIKDKLHEMLTRISETYGNLCEVNVMAYTDPSKYIDYNTKDCTDDNRFLITNLISETGFVNNGAVLKQTTKNLKARGGGRDKEGVIMGLYALCLNNAIDSEVNVGMLFGDAGYEKTINYKIHHNDIEKYKDACAKSSIFKNMFVLKNSGNEVENLKGVSQEDIKGAKGNYTIEITYAKVIDYLQKMNVKVDTFIIASEHSPNELKNFSNETGGVSSDFDPKDTTNDLSKLVEKKFTTEVYALG